MTTTCHCPEHPSKGWADFEGLCARCYRSRDCKAYDAQLTWTKRVRRLLASDGLEVPAPPTLHGDYRDMPLLTGSLATGYRPNTWARETYRLLEQDGRAYRQFSAAIRQAKGETK